MYQCSCTYHVNRSWSLHKLLFSKLSKYFLKNSMEFGRPIFFLQCYKNRYVYKTKHTFNLLVSKTSPKCISEHLLFFIKIDLLVFTKCSFDFCFALSKFIFLGLISAWTHWRYLDVQLHIHIWYMHTHTCTYIWGVATGVE